jgi:hypothetical protein
LCSISNEVKGRCSAVYQTICEKGKKPGLELEFDHLDMTMEENICQMISRIILEAKE